MIEGGGAGEEGEPAPESVFVGEGFDMFGDFDHGLLEEVAGELFVSVRDNKEVGEEAVEVGVEKLAIGVFDAAAHGGGELCDGMRIARGRHRGGGRAFGGAHWA